ncbi:MAG: site-2 protease family protein [Clostridia bacterium]|nr:site-2 protease family protein [Clostridia bacterium]
MLFSILSGGDVREMIINLLLLIPVIIISLSVHEAAHGYMAYRMGDRTAYNCGRVTLNPAKHLDPMGSLCMLVFGYGWAKPVPINARNFRNPKYGMAYTAIAGPISNILLGIIGTILYAVVNFLLYYFWADIAGNEFLANVLRAILTLLFYLGYMNFVLAIFNLIPIPPFDGSRFFSLFLPAKTYFAMMKYERYIMVGILVFMIVCSRLFNFSPFGWLAEKLFDLVYEPITKLLLLIFA